MKTLLSYSMILALVLTTACGQSKKGKPVANSAPVTTDNIDQATLNDILGTYAGTMRVNGVPGQFQLRLTLKDYQGATYLYGELQGYGQNNSYIIQIPSDVSTPSYMGMFKEGSGYVFASSYQWLQVFRKWSSLEYSFQGRGAYGLSFKDCTNVNGDRCMAPLAGMEITDFRKQ